MTQDPKPRRNIRAMITQIGLIGAVVAIAAILFAIPMPYVIESPGPALNVLDSAIVGEQKEAIIQVEDAKGPVDKNGKLYMVTVSMRGGPGSHISGAELLVSMLDKKSNILPVEQVYPKGVTRKQIQQVSEAQMASSQENAAVVALDLAGKPTPATLTIAAVMDSSPLKGKAEVNDKIHAITTPDGKRTEIVYATTLHQILGQTPGGSKVEVELKRGEEIHKYEVKTLASPHWQGSRLGVGVSTKLELPSKVKIKAGDITGPSAGLAFSLATLEMLTGKPIIGDLSVAATGSINLGGYVEPIGGVVQKMWGAHAKGATVFLLPTENCNEAAGNEPKGMKAIPVKSVSDAIDQLANLRAAKPVATCPAA